LKTTQELHNDGFTESGISRYEQTIKEYSESVYSKSIILGRLDQAKDLPLEVTHEHVRNATYAIGKSYGKEQKTPWMVACNVAEYAFTAIAGIGGGNLNKDWGILCFSIPLAIVVILIVVRLTKSK
jgi:hypothetical protein